MSVCARCGSRSTLEGSFTRRRSLVGRDRLYCPRCMRARREQVGRRAFRLLALLPLIGIVLLAAGRLAGFGTASGWAVVNVWLFLLFGYLAVVPHELGHALVAKAVGFRVFSMSCGVGPVLFERIVRGVRVCVRAFPIDGATLVAPAGQGGYRWKQALVVAAGPAVNATCLVGALLLRPPLHFGALTDGPALGLAFVAANAFAVAINLLPLKVATTHGALPNDGLSLLEAARLGSTAIEEAIAVRYILEAQACADDGRLRDAVAWIQRGLDHQPAAPSLHMAMGYTCALLGDCEEARRRFAYVADLPGVAPEAQATAWNNIAWADVVSGRRHGLDEADRLSQRALETLGWTPAFKGTRGAVLVALGRIDEGLTLLEQALHEGTDEELHPLARATYMGAMALGLLAQGERHAAQRHLEAARRDFPSCPLLPHVESALGADAPAPTPAPPTASA